MFYLLDGLDLKLQLCHGNPLLEQFDTLPYISLATVATQLLEVQQSEGEIFLQIDHLAERVGSISEEKVNWLVTDESVLWIVTWLLHPQSSARFVTNLRAWERWFLYSLSLPYSLSLVFFLSPAPSPHLSLSLSLFPSSISNTFTYMYTAKHSS